MSNSTGKDPDPEAREATSDSAQSAEILGRYIFLSALSLSVALVIIAFNNAVTQFFNKIGWYYLFLIVVLLIYFWAQDYDEDSTPKAHSNHKEDKPQP
jgi:Ca2+/Na+ antiporter